MIVSKLKFLFLLYVILLNSSAYSQNKYFVAQKVDNKHFVEILANYKSSTYKPDIVETISDNRQLILIPGFLKKGYDGKLYRKVLLYGKSVGYVNAEEVILLESNNQFKLLKNFYLVGENIYIDEGIDNEKELVNELSENFKYSLMIVEKEGKYFVVMEIKGKEGSFVRASRSNSGFLLPVNLLYGKPWVSFLDEKGMYIDAYENRPDKKGTLSKEKLKISEHVVNGSINWNEIVYSYNKSEDVIIKKLQLEKIDLNEYVDKSVDWNDYTNTSNVKQPYAKSVQIIIPVSGKRNDILKFITPKSVKFITKLSLQPDSRNESFYQSVFINSLLGKTEKDTFVHHIDKNTLKKEYVLDKEESNTLELDEVLKIEISKGTVDENYRCELEKNKDFELPTISGYSIYGNVYSLNHEGIFLKKKANIKIKLDQEYVEGKYSIARYHDRIIEILDTAFKDGYLLAETSAFSSFFIVEKRTINIEQAEKSIFKRNQKFYEAKVRNGESIHIYGNNFNFLETKIIGKLYPSENFLAYAGMSNGKVRKVVTKKGLEGFVYSDEIEIIGNHNGFENLKNYSNLEIYQDEILLERLKENKEILKESIYKNYIFHLNSGVKNGMNYVLIELESKNNNFSIMTHRSGFGLMLSKKFLVDKENIELNYYEKNGLFIDAIGLSHEYEDYYEDALSVFGLATSSIETVMYHFFGIELSKKFMESVGVGEIETPLDSNLYEESDEDKQLIDKYYGSYQHANTFLYPEASLVQIAIPVMNSLDEIKTIIKETELKLMLGTYLNNKVGRCTIVKSFGSESLCNDESFQGEYSTKKALSVIFEEHIIKGETIEWNNSRFIKEENLSGFLNRNGSYESKILSQLDIDEKSKVLVLENLSFESGRINGPLISLFLFKKCNNNWQLTNWFSEEFCCYGYKLEIRNLGSEYGYFVFSDNFAQGHSYYIVDVLIPVNKTFKKVLTETIGMHNGGAAESSDDRYGYSSKITSKSSNRKYYDIIVHKIGKRRKDNGQIFDLDEKKIYQYFGNKYELAE